MKKNIIAFILTLISHTVTAYYKYPDIEPRVLLFYKTAGFHHTSIARGVEAIKTLGAAHGFIVDTSTDATMFNDSTLARYNAVIFLNTSGTLFNHPQRKAFMHYIQSGGGFAGIHAATDTETDWPWYVKLAGAIFLNHPAPQFAKLVIKDTTHLSTKHLPLSWTRTDEWYNFKQLNPEVNVLITIDETSYEGGSHGHFHPIAWYHAYDGGRAFYTALGHSEESYTEPFFLQHLLGGIQYAMGIQKK
ncbi:MAG TPA: ThuA domain-containing protein [Ferruginibacter sp.]|nr:ThuA domain-containing protein [Ferruginibacter sp.]HMP19853.1 ThuA domain-containing protein [Ferruginibacter sp.]